ncbi:hypothetical protein C8Q79DRAFT_213606 [Trametes meyenii]|nr:hypothetical protein C8Q79DRAFT_213606 [Trametes meyenii]
MCLMFGQATRTTLGRRGRGIRALLRMPTCRAHTAPPSGIEQRAFNYSVMRRREGPHHIYAGGTVPALRGHLRRVFKRSLVRITGDKSASMYYARSTYFAHLYNRRHVQLKGWPSNIPFTNLSRLRKAELLILYRCWRKKRMYFVVVDEDEVRANARHPERVSPDIYDVGPHSISRNDNKTSRFDKQTGLPVSEKRKLRTSGAKSSKTVPDGL